MNKKLREFIKKEHKRLMRIYYSKADEQKRSLARTVKIAEELGELSSEIMALYNDQRKDKIKRNIKEKIAEECADVIITTLLLAENLNINVSRAIDKKIKIIEKRWEKILRGKIKK